MKTLSLKELVKGAPALVSMIKKGEEVTLTENGRQLAKIVPLRTFTKNAATRRAGSRTIHRPEGFQRSIAGSGIAGF